ncbi:type I methionyl aminopeptidase [Paenibacillus sp. 481]|uniref:type I methionyl aminopeptidase n=1 Tax=Paenibacillus sp. 481 TaxID=2835869 RepID=UPI001E2E3860|nr:type I methionyl aminopeptidase [Paenibacillus sp. 481]UHA72188.1 type I methionyl aminopeptidase [Paenibacillus sp. 481]
MVILKKPDEIELMKKAGQIVAACHRELATRIKPGVTTLELNDFVEQMIHDLGGKQVTKGYKGFPFATCASVNDVIAHGFPNSVPLQQGDIVKIDIVASYNGWMGDSAWCYTVGPVSDEAQQIMRVTKECLYLGIEQAIIGNRIGDVTHAIQKHAESHGYTIVRELLGHGIGRSLHEAPSFVHAGVPGKGFRLREGMVITIEPMLNEGTADIFLDLDGWTVRTWDGKLSAQYEHTIAITKNGPIILTDQQHTL